MDVTDLELFNGYRQCRRHTTLEPWGNDCRAQGEGQGLGALCEGLRPEAWGRSAISSRMATKCCKKQRFCLEWAVLLRRNGAAVVKLL